MIEAAKRFYNENQKMVLAILAVVAAYLIYEYSCQVKQGKNKVHDKASGAGAEKKAGKGGDKKARKGGDKKAEKKEEKKVEEFKNKKKILPKRVIKSVDKKENFTSTKKTVKPAKKIPEGAPSEFFHFK